jgi:hypothetical protein
MRLAGYLGRSEILAARLRQQQEEEIRERGELISPLRAG